MTIEPSTDFIFHHSLLLDSSPEPCPGSRLPDMGSMRSPDPSALAFRILHSEPPFPRRAERLRPSVAGKRRGIAPGACANTHTPHPSGPAWNPACIRYTRPATQIDSHSEAQ